MPKFLAVYFLVIFTLIAQAEPKVPDLDDNITSQCSGFTNEVSTAQLNGYRPMTGQRSHRLWHLFFHGLRSAWSSLSQSDRDLLATIHPTLVVPRPFGMTNSSSDFLYYHRIMNRMVREELVKAGLPCIASWTQPPAVSDTVWPVPPLWSGAAPMTIFGKSSAAYLTMLSLHKQLHDPKWLKGKSFSDFGAAAEGVIHLLFHNRFAAQAKYGKRPLMNIQSAPPEEFNSLDNENFLDTYSTMQNPMFWKAHAYLDDSIDGWLTVNGYTSIAVNCSGKAGCFQWPGTWLGPVPEEICDCEDHEGHDEGGAHVHEVDVYTLFIDYAKAHPEKASQLDRILKTLDMKSAFGFFN